MNFAETPLRGAYIVVPEPIEDERGFFARIFAAEEFEARRLESRWIQFSLAYNRRMGTLRGLHFQAEPYAEAKMVQCTRKSIYDVILDLRRESPTYRQWFAVELSSENRKILYVPKGFAHGYQTLQDDCEVAYHVSAPYRPGAASGVRWNDPAFGIRWPLPDPILSDRDRAFHDYHS